MWPFSKKEELPKKVVFIPKNQYVISCDPLEWPAAYEHFIKTILDPAETNSDFYYISKIVHDGNSHYVSVARNYLFD